MGVQRARVARVRARRGPRGEHCARCRHAGRGALAVVTSRPLQVVGVVALALLGACETSSPPAGTPTHQPHRGRSAGSTPRSKRRAAGRRAVSTWGGQDPPPSTFRIRSSRARGPRARRAVEPRLRGVPHVPCRAEGDRRAESAWRIRPARGRCPGFRRTPPALRAAIWFGRRGRSRRRLADPARFVAGTTMTFTGYRSPADRRDLIAYLLPRPSEAEVFGPLRYPGAYGAAIRRIALRFSVTQCPNGPENSPKPCR